MKDLLLKYRWFAALAMGAALAACGGYTAVNLGGSVTGLETAGLVLENMGATVAIPANAKLYVFPGQIPDDGKYAITVKNHPLQFTCSVSGANGIATGIAITSANVFCSRNTYTLGGTISGLTNDGLQLVNGSDDILKTIAVGTTSFVFPKPVGDGISYTVGVVKQPLNGQTCTVQNGSRVMGSSKVDDVTVVCK